MSPRGELARRDDAEGGEGEGGRILDVRLSGPPELIDAAVKALRLVLDVADVSRPYTNRRSGGQRVYVRALGLSPEARRFLARERVR